MVGLGEVPVSLAFGCLPVSACWDLVLDESGFDSMRDVMPGVEHLEILWLRDESVVALSS
jgi:hypothetical protein